MRYLKKWRAATTDPELVKKAVEINGQIVQRGSLFNRYLREVTSDHFMVAGVSGTCLQIWRIKQQSRTALRSVKLVHLV